MKIEYTIFSEETLSIIGFGSCFECDFSMQQFPGGIIVAGIFKEDEFYIKNGEIKKYTESEREAKLNRPHFHAEWSNSLMKWVDLRSPEQIKQDFQARQKICLDQVDASAGVARTRYITSAHGQVETYTIKERQAREWTAASYAGDPPSFIAAEAAATNVTPQALCQMVIELADFWSNIKGPQIEATRRKWKVAIEAASDPSLIQGLVDAARAELDAL